MDMTILDETIAIFDSVYQHRKAHPTTLSDELYYWLILEHHKRLRSAKDEGKYIAAFSVAIPTEIFFAMDIVPYGLEVIPQVIGTTLDKFEEAFSAARGYGLLPEVCSYHRCGAGMIILDWLPHPDFAVWSNMVCDNTAKGGEIFAERYNSIPYFVDVPYRYTERETQYLTQELEDLVHLLEEHTQQKMDWDRLKEAVEYTRQMVELQREIYELRKAVPVPMRNRQITRTMMSNWYWGGAPESIPYLKALRDEMKEKVEEKKGYVAEERFRLLTLMVPPVVSGVKILDWMEREHGAIIAADPYLSHWGNVDIDPSKPLESLARKLLTYPVCRQMLGPLKEGAIRDCVKDAIDYKVDGAIFFAHIGCRQSCAALRTYKDALKKEADIPTLILDVDLVDPTFISDEELKDKLEGLFEILEDRK